MSKVEDKGRLNFKYDKFDKLDTATLEAILRADFDAPEAEEMAAEEVLYIASLIAERQNALKPDIDKAQEEFYQYYYPLDKPIYDFGDEEDSSEFNTKLEQSPNGSNVLPFYKKVWRSFASVAAVFVLFLFVGTVTAYALGYNPVQYIGRWNDEQFWLEHVPITQELANKVAEYSYIACVPKWLPNNYKFGDFEIYEHGSYINIASDFYKETDDSKKILFIDYNIYSNLNQLALYEKDSNEVTEYVYGDITHYIMSNLDSTTIVWYNGNIECSIKGSISLDEAKKIINSIYGE